jgi:hypothetical protein
MVMKNFGPFCWVAPSIISYPSIISLLISLQLFFYWFIHVSASQIMYSQTVNSAAHFLALRSVYPHTLSNSSILLIRTNLTVLLSLHHAPLCHLNLMNSSANPLFSLIFYHVSNPLLSLPRSTDITLRNSTPHPIQGHRKRWKGFETPIT